MDDVGGRQAGSALDRGAGALPVPLRAMPQQQGPDRRLRTLLEQLRTEAGLADRQGDGEAADALRAAAVALASRHGAVTREVLPRLSGPVRATCFGSFALTVGGLPLALGGLRPRARSALRLLAVQRGRPLHRDVLLASLWPDSSEGASSASMRTTLSSLRAVLAPTPAAGALVRDGSAYLLDPTTVTTDVVLADEALTRAQRTRQDDPAAADADYEAALDLYTGDLLVEEGPAEWVVDVREEWRVRMATAAHELAVLRTRAGRHAAAVAAARRGLVLDRHSDPLWRVLVAALRADGDAVAADRAATEYADLLDELAVS